MSSWVCGRKEKLVSLEESRQESSEDCDLRSGVIPFMFAMLMMSELKMKKAIQCLREPVVTKTKSLLCL